MALRADTTGQTGVMADRLVLASTSRYRAEVLASAGYSFDVEAPEIDERAFDDRFESWGPQRYVMELATAKAEAVARRLMGDGPELSQRHLVLGCDQIAVLGGDDRPTLLHKPGSAERAVAQLMEMSGRTHRLMNAFVLVDASDGERWSEIDVHHVTMRSYTVGEACEYVDRFEPLDCAGSYRIEDDADLLDRVEGEHRSGVIGLSIPSVARLLDAAGSGSSIPRS